MNPSELLPGTWCLYEYYTEPSGELLHFRENQLLEENLTWFIEFFPDNRFTCKTNLAVALIQGLEKGSWIKSRNYIVLKESNNTAKTVKFQFSVEKESLKLLKKDSLGKIEIFGFFRKIS